MPVGVTAAVVVVAGVTVDDVLVALGKIVFVGAVLIIVSLVAATTNKIKIGNYYKHN